MIVVGRGGGSIEDLWAFNEEIVADAIFRARTPIVSAVGHEIDWVISDFVADVRAATPSVAMEICLPDTNELYQYLDTISAQLTQTISQKVYNKTQELTHLQNSYMQHSVEKKLTQKIQEVNQLKEVYNQTVSFKFKNYAKEIEHIKVRFPHAIDSVINVAQNQVLNLQKMLKSNNPKIKSKSGFAQISKDKKVIDISELKIDDSFELQSDEVYLHAVVTSKEVK